MTASATPWWAFDCPRCRRPVAVYEGVYLDHQDRRKAVPSLCPLSGEPVECTCLTLPVWRCPVHPEGDGPEEGR